MRICGVADDVSSGEYALGLLVLLVSKYMKTNTVKNASIAAFNPLKNYFQSDSFKILSVYYMHHDTF